jgi:RND family efflux transporter MFP subunit
MFIGEVWMSHIWVKRLLPVVIIIIALFIGWLLVAMQSSPEKKPNIQPSPNVEVLTIERQPFQLTVSSQGTVSAKRTIEWASKVAGRVIWVDPQFVEGGQVAAGTLLLKLDPIDHEVAVAQAQANLADANLTLTEERSEVRRGTHYRANNAQEAAKSLRQPKLAQVEAKYKAAQATLKQAQADLAATEIKAPFAAVIDNKQVDLGQYVSAGKVLFNLLNTETAEVRLPVTTADIGFIQSQIPLNNDYPAVKLSANFGQIEQIWQGRLVRIERRVDRDTRTFFVVAEVDQPYDLARYSIPLSVGLFVNADIEGISVNDAVSIPRAALHDDTFVYLVSDGVLLRDDVTVLRREYDSVVISQGLENGDQLVMTKLDLMVEGMKVTAMPRTAVLTPALGDAMTQQHGELEPVKQAATQQ